MEKSPGKLKEKYWKDHIRRFHQSGQNRRQYCLTENLSYWTFRDWLKKVENIKDEKLVKVPLPAYSQRRTDETGIEIVIQEKISIRIKSGFNGELLRNILTELGVRI